MVKARTSSRSMTKNYRMCQKTQRKQEQALDELQKTTGCVKRHDESKNKLLINDKKLQDVSKDTAKARTSSR